MPGSSPELEESTDATAQTVDPTAASSEAETKGAEPTLLDAVQAALEPKEQSPSSVQDQDPPDPATTRADKPKGEEADQLPDEVSEDELKSYAPKTQKRIRQLLDERSTLRSQSQQLTERLKAYEPIEQVIGAGRLDQQEVQNTLQIATLIKTDPFRALEVLKPITDKLSEITGATLPADLREQVRLGYITQKHAEELARSKSQAAHLTRTSQEERQRQEQERQRQAQETFVSDLATSANEWEAAKKASDPDYALKQSRVMDRLKVAVFEQGLPKTKADAVKLLDSIHADVTKEMRSLIPQRRAVTPVTGGASPEARPEAKSVLDVVRNTLTAS